MEASEMFKPNHTLSELIEAAEKELVKLNYCKVSISIAKTTWRKFELYANKHSSLYFTQELAMTFLLEHYNYPDKEARFHPTYVNAIASAIRKLGDLQLHGRFLSREKKKFLFITNEFQPAIDEFIVYCKKRNIAENSNDRNLRRLNNFFEYLSTIRVTKPSEINAMHISGYMSSLSGYSRGTVKCEIYSLRLFFRSIYFSGLSTIDLSNSIPKLRFPEGDKVPIIWESSNVEKLLKAVDRGSPLGKRDYAILLIVVKLGLRDCDIRKLKLENIKWKANRIEFIQSKTSQFLSLPLLPEIGDAIIDYLKYGRPNSDSQHIFIKHVAPYSNFNKTGNIVTKYLEISKIPIDKTKSHGIHTLRHTLASRLLEKEVPLDIISAILGHISINSAKEYMHIDIENLRKCSIELDECYE